MNKRIRRKWSKKYGSCPRCGSFKTTSIRFLVPDATYYGTIRCYRCKPMTENERWLRSKEREERRHGHFDPSLSTKPNVLFLDIDGVLNSRESRGWLPRMTMFEGHPFFSPFDPVCIQNMNRLVKEGNCDVVLSSVWRQGRPWEVTSRYLQHCGATFHLIGATSLGFYIHDEERHSIRGDEIEAWRKAFNDTRPFIIVDDDSDMTPYMDRLAWCDGVFGIQEDTVEKGLQLLGF